MPPLTGEDLERWRLANNLSKTEAARVFGLQLNAWRAYVEATEDFVKDKAVRRTYELYTQYPETVPVEVKPSLLEFYSELGFDPDSLKDIHEFGRLIGRSQENMYRIIKDEGGTSPQVIRLIQTILKLPKKQRIRVLREIRDKIELEDRESSSHADE